MSNEEAIEILNSWYGEDKESDEVINLAIEALEKYKEVNNIE